MAYLIQDYIFLIHFSRAWALAIVKSETPEQMRGAAATVNALINDEIKLHVGICAREGITEAQLLDATEEPENLAYTRYVMDAACLETSSICLQHSLPVFLVMRILVIVCRNVMTPLRSIVNGSILMIRMITNLSVFQWHR